MTQEQEDMKKEIIEVSLRDYFAAAALTPMVGRALSVESFQTTQYIAKISYSIADAMLKEREEKDAKEV